MHPSSTLFGATTELINSTGTTVPIDQNTLVNTGLTSHTDSSLPTTTQPTAGSSFLTELHDPSAPEPTSSTGTLTDHSIIIDIPLPKDLNSSSESEFDDENLTVLKNNFVASVADKFNQSLSESIKEFQATEQTRVVPLIPKKNDELRERVLIQSVHKQLSDLKQKYLLISNKVSQKRKRLNDTTLNESLLANTTAEEQAINIQKLEADLAKSNATRDEIIEQFTRLNKYKDELLEANQQLLATHIAEKEQIQKETQEFINTKLAEQHQAIEAEA